MNYKPRTKRLMRSQDTRKSFSLAFKAGICNPRPCTSERSSAASPSPCRSRRPAWKPCIGLHAKVKVGTGPLRGRSREVITRPPSHPRQTSSQVLAPAATNRGEVSRVGAAACQGAALCRTDAACRGPILSSFSLVLPITPNEAKGASRRF